jgi:hypothetical protein
LTRSVTAVGAVNIAARNKGNKTTPAVKLFRRSLALD